MSESRLLPTPVRYRGKCLVRDCKFRTVIDQESSPALRPYAPTGGIVVLRLWDPERECLIQLRYTDRWQLDAHRAAKLTCPEHDRPLDWVRIRASYRADKKCNAACRSARERDCVCSCGGANHGSALLLRQETPDSQDSPDEAPSGQPEPLEAVTPAQGTPVDPAAFRGILAVDFRRALEKVVPERLRQELVYVTSRDWDPVVDYVSGPLARYLAQGPSFDDLQSFLGEGLHTAFRKAIGTGWALSVHRGIDDLPDEVWATLVRRLAFKICQIVGRDEFVQEVAQTRDARLRELQGILAGEPAREAQDESDLTEVARATLRHRARALAEALGEPDQDPGDSDWYYGLVWKVQEIRRDRGALAARVEALQGDAQIRARRLASALGVLTVPTDQGDPDWYYGLVEKVSQLRVARDDLAAQVDSLRGVRTQEQDPAQERAKEHETYRPHWAGGRPARALPFGLTVGDLTDQELWDVAVERARILDDQSREPDREVETLKELLARERAASTHLSRNQDQMLARRIAAERNLALVQARIEEVAQGFQDLLPDLAARLQACASIGLVEPEDVELPDPSDLVPIREIVRALKTGFWPGSQHQASCGCSPYDSFKAPFCQRHTLLPGLGARLDQVLQEAELNAEPFDFEAGLAALRAEWNRTIGLVQDGPEDSPDSDEVPGNAD
jgi:hypothetical protein